MQVHIISIYKNTEKPKIFLFPTAEEARSNMLEIAESYLNKKEYEIIANKINLDEVAGFIVEFVDYDFEVYYNVSELDI